MLQKIKDLMRIQEEIDKISKKIDEQSSKVDSFSKEMAELKRQLEESNKSQKEFLGELKNNLGIIKESKESLQKEVYDFKLLKTHVQNKLMDKFNEELEKELKACKENLKADIKSYSEVKKDVE